MIVVTLCCNLICGCLTPENKHTQCPINWDGLNVQFVEICNPEKPNGMGLECECLNERLKK